VREVESDPFSASRYCVSVTCSRDGRSHQISDVILADELMRGSSGMTALCGRTIVAAALSDPPGPPCPLCTAALELDRPRSRRT
jgi:hypothetical protein